MHRHTLRSVFSLGFTVGLLLGLGVRASLADDWPGWRGPLRSGVTADRGAPLTWSATDNIRWKTPLVGIGISNPVVCGDRVFLTAAEGRDQGEVLVLCFDRDTGDIRWRRKLWGTAPSTFYYPKSGLATPTPVTDGERLWVFFSTGDLFCFDLDGGLLWQRALAKEYGPFENRFAASSSPLLFQHKSPHDTLILQCDHYGPSYLLAVESRTGANRWKAERPDVWLSWSSPQLIPVGGRFELLVSGSERLDGYDPVTGLKLWTVKGLARECVPTPLVHDGRAFVVSGPNGAHMAVEPGGKGDVTGTHVKWRSDKGTSFVPSGIIVNDRYYLADDKGIATCFRCDTGEILWRKRLHGKITASPVSFDGKILFTNEQGSTLVLDATRPDYEEIARNDLAEDVFASPAIAQGYLFFRTTKHLVCVGKR